ncbi:MAG: secondary thiamine-phosphate synthase enzyme YjbQ [Candidatus Saccharicenans sp.]|nr:secondary thiamine-phosphate synthase enzyme YjbQ [Candidatus Saccharicenans sp.]MDH7574583.1 secondary thiamine-phosphate synthase enzyme YjbQ [Candidatus Saccharicenans sp.]
MHQLSLETSRKEEFLNITGKIQALVRASGIRSGLAVIFCPHTTCGLTINEQADPDVRADILMALRKIVPDNLPYTHAEGNSPAHIKTSLVGSSLMVMIENGELLLGTWQGIFLCEFDGPRNRQVWVRLLESGKD